MTNLMTISNSRLRLGVLLAFTFPCAALAQATHGGTLPPATAPPTLSPDAAQTAEILGLTAPIAKLRTMQSHSPCNSVMSPDELSIRQELSELIQASNLDVDGVLGEISNERSELGDLRTALQSRRDHTVGFLNSAALITGSGLGTVVTATQFTRLSSTTQNIGDGIGIGSGVASTLLSFMAVRKQNGPKASVGDMPNMLAPLFDKVAVLQTYYPPSVLRYLQSVPPGQDPDRGTRLEQLKAEWVETGRLDGSGSGKESHTIATASTSRDPSVKVTINDLTNRIAMLGDVSGRVSLMKRDLAMIMRSYTDAAGRCAVEDQLQR